MLDVMSLQGLQDLRAQFEESAAPGEYPATCAGELMLLADVCSVIGLGETETRQVLGDAAFCLVAELTGGK